MALFFKIGVSIPGKMIYMLRQDPISMLTYGLLNMKMSSYQYKNSHYEDKMVMRPSYLYNRNPCTWKDGHYIETGPSSLPILHVDMFTGRYNAQ